MQLHVERQLRQVEEENMKVKAKAEVVTHFRQKLAMNGSKLVASFGTWRQVTDDMEHMWSMQGRHFCVG